MISLPKPLSARAAQGMPQRRRKSGLRTAAGSLQELFLERVAELRDDPTIILPDCPNGEPRPLAKLRRQLEALKAGRTPWAARFDRHILGAVARSRAVADREKVPRLLDAKVAGQRRFYLHTGHVAAACTLGVQNHDEPRVLMVAYGSMAKRHGLHFFAGERLWCSGAVPQPPPEWIVGLTEAGNVTFTASAEAGWDCPHNDRPRVRLQWRDGPWLQACAECGTRVGGLHRRVREGYLGPRVRQPVEVDVRLPDGFVHVPERESLARYRAGLAGEGELSAAAAAAWRAVGAGRWAVGEKAFASAQAFIDHLAPQPWEKPVLAALVANGFVAKHATVASVFAERSGALGAALGALIDDGPAFAAQRPGLPPRDLARAAHEEARRRTARAQLPVLAGLGPQGAWVDALARAALAEGRDAATALLRRSMDAPPVPRTTLFAFLQALGGALDLQASFTSEEQAAAQPLAGLASQVLAATGEAYVQAVRELLRLTGSGEEPRQA